MMKRNHIKNSSRAEVAQTESMSPLVSPCLAVELDNASDVEGLTQWDVDFRQIEPGRMKTSLVTRESRTMSLLSIEVSRKLHQRGTPPPGWNAFAIVAPHHLKSWQGNGVNEGTLLSFGAVTGFESVSEADFFARIVSFDAEKLARAAAAFGLDSSDTLESSIQFQAEGDAHRLHRLNRFITAHLHPDAAEWSAAEEETALLDILSITANARQKSDRSSARVRAIALRRAIELMEATLFDPVKISEICRASGASWKTLERAFAEKFDMGPKAYYLRLRLNRARHDLLVAPPTAHVADIANLYGFWHLGQFARDYRGHFAELPSETLARV